MSNEITIEAMNEVIGIFMGGMYKDVNVGGRPYRRFYMPGKSGWDYCKTTKSLGYHESWDELMPCWNQLRTVVADHFNEDYPAEYCSMCDIWGLHCEHVNIHGAYTLLFDSIIWFNQQKQNNDTKQQNRI